MHWMCMPQNLQILPCYLFQYYSITAAQITASHSEPAMENSVPRVQVRKPVAKNQNIYFHNYKQSATDLSLQPSVSFWVE